MNNKLKINPKVAAASVAAAVVVIFTAITQGVTDPTTLIGAIMTVVQFVAGFFTPAAQ